MVLQKHLRGRQGFVLLLQWHPEAMWRKNPLFLKPFKAFVKAAEQFSLLTWRILVNNGIRYFTVYE